MVVRRVFKDSYGSGNDKSYATKYSLLAISKTAYLKGEQKANTSKLRARASDPFDAAR